jgi:hypothetical protein
MRTIPYAKLARAFGPRDPRPIAALGHRFIPYGQVEMLCRPCGFVIWKVDDAEGAEQAVRQLGGEECPYDNRTLGEQIAEDYASAIEAGTVETEGLDAKHESAAPKADAQKEGS